MISYENINEAYILSGSIGIKLALTECLKHRFATRRIKLPAPRGKSRALSDKMTLPFCSGNRRI